GLRAVGVLLEVQQGAEGGGERRLFAYRHLLIADEDMFEPEMRPVMCGACVAKHLQRCAKMAQKDPVRRAGGYHTEQSTGVPRHFTPRVQNIDLRLIKVVNHITSLTPKRCLRVNGLETHCMPESTLLIMSTNG